MRIAWVCLTVFLLSCGQSADKSDPDGGRANNIASNNTSNNATTNNAPNNGSTTNNATTNNAPNNETPNNIAAPSHMTFVEVGFDDPIVVYTPDGTAHLAYSYGPGPNRLVYGECGQNCADSSGWSFVELASADLLDDVRMSSDASGRLHLVHSTSGFGAGTGQTFYRTCNLNCTNAASWSSVDLTPAMDNTWAVYRGSPVAVSASGGVYMISSDGTINPRMWLTQCASNCQNGANWSSGQIRQGGNRSTLAVNGTTLHHVFYNNTGGLVYATCSANCTLAASWQESPQIFAYDGNGQVRVAVVDGEIRVVYNQGIVGDPTPAVQSQNERLLFWTCSSNCLNPAGWAGVVVAQPKDGFSLAMENMGSATVLALVGEDLTYTVYACNGNCLDATMWGSLQIDTSSEMTDMLDPYSLLCGGSRPYFAGWYVERPSVAISSVTGAALFASVGSLLQQCSSGGQYFKSNGMGRLAYLQ